MKTVIFDFDGTIADTWKVILKIFKEKEEEWGLPEISEETIADFRGKPFFELLRKYNIVLLKLPFIVSKTQKELKDRMGQVSIFKGIKDVVFALKKRSFTLGILTTNSEGNVRSFLKIHDLDVFDFIRSERSILGKDKALRKVLKKNNLRTDEVFYIGDEIRDIDAAKEVGVRIISVTWGFNTKEILKKSKPDFLVDTPSEILKTISK